MRYILSTKFRSQVLKDGKRKKIIESIERAHVGHALKSATEAGASMFQKIQNARAEKGHTSSSAISDSNSNSTKCKTCILLNQINHLYPDYRVNIITETNVHLWRISGRRRISGSRWVHFHGQHGQPGDGRWNSSQGCCGSGGGTCR